MEIGENPDQCQQCWFKLSHFTDTLSLPVPAHGDGRYSGPGPSYEGHTYVFPLADVLALAKDVSQPSIHPSVHHLNIHPSLHPSSKHPNIQASIRPSFHHPYIIHVFQTRGVALPSGQRHVLLQIGTPPHHRVQTKK